MKKYKLTKTIRFKLEQVNAPTIKTITENLINNESCNKLAPLIDKGIQIKEYLEEYIFVSSEKKKLKKTVKVNFRWLKQYTKEKFYEWVGDKKVDKRIAIHDVTYLNEIFSDLILVWSKTLENLREAISSPEESKVSKSKIAFGIRKLSTRQMFPFIESFINESREKDTDELWQKLKTTATEFKNLLAECEKWALPAQSSGLEIARASFNYYTINKKPNDYEKEREIIKNQLNEFPDTIKLSGLPGYNLLFKYDKQYFVKINEGFSLATLDNIFYALKKFKSEQKRNFVEAVTRGKTYDEIKNDYPLFYGNPVAFKKYLEFTSEINFKAERKSKIVNESEEAKKLSDEIKKLKILRGKLFFNGESNKGETTLRFNNYINFCKIFGKVALNRGKLIARLRNIDREEIDSQRLQYWAIISEQNGQHYLILIPKRKSQQAYNQLSRWRDDFNGSVSFYYFESLTYRSLKKLCFGINGNTFIPEVKNELKQKSLWNYPEDKFGEYFFKKNDSRDEQGIINFYKLVLSTDYVKQNLKLPENFTAEVLDKTFASEEEFRIQLEKCCYVRHKKISGEGFENFLNDNEAQVFKITSYDLEKIRNKNYNNLKAHTQLWLDFWNDNNEQQKYPLRLNPEISITWREPKKSRVEKYGEVTKLYDPKKHNRYLHSQFTLITTFTENALSSEITYAFQDIKKKGEAIKDFNKQINDHFSKKIESNKLWFYGIDTGQVELATLCLIGSNGKPQMFQVLELKRDKYDYEKTGFLKNGTEKKYKAISNLSYFLNQSIYERTFRDGKFNQTFNELFEKKEVPAIDLSKAKLINGHIVEYGDIFSYDRLKKINKMRQEERKNALTLEKINHVRQALVSNMVGIINYLYQKFPGFIILEDNPQSWIEDERMKFEGRLERPLEWALYRKFQEVGLTPPISELVRLREEFKVAISKGKQTANQKLKQFGIVCFVNKEGTSLHCPSCGNKAYKDDKEIKQDKSKKIFRCKSCGYHNHNESKDYPGLDNNDKVAAFNIAKMGLKFFKI